MTPPVFIIGETAYRRWKLWQMSELPTISQICAMFSVSRATAQRDRSLIAQAQRMAQSSKRNRLVHSNGFCSGVTAKEDEHV